MPKRKHRRAQGEGSIRRRDNGLYEARWTDPQTKKRHSAYGATQAEALEERDRIRSEIAQGYDTASANTYTAAFIEGYIDNAPLEESTRTNYRSLFNNHLRKPLERILLKDLRAEHLEAIYTKMTKAGLKSATVHRANTLLSGALTQAQDRGYVLRHAAKLAKKPKLQYKDIEPLTEEEVRRLLEACAGDRLGTICALAVTTGMRQGEILGLRWNDIDFARRRLSVRRNLRDIGGHLSLANVKTRGSRRTIPLAPQVVEMLEEHRIQQAKERKAVKNYHDLGLVFATVDGKPLNRSNLRRRFLTLRDEAGLSESFTFHDLRHTAATYMLARGFNVKVVSEILGHASPQITLSTYAHVLPPMLDEVGDAMAQQFLLKTG